MDKKSHKLLAQANIRLKGSKVKIEYRESGRGLYLRGTFPPKPLSSKTQPYRQRIPLRNEHGLLVRGICAGIQFAGQKAKQLSADLNLDRFDWKNWLNAA